MNLVTLLTDNSEVNKLIRAKNDEVGYKFAYFISGFIVVLFVVQAILLAKETS